MSNLSAALAAFLDKRSRLAAAKANQKAALEALGRSPGNDWSAYPDELRAVTGGSGTYQDSKTVTADPAGMTILPDEGYSGMLKAIIAAEPNFQPWNLVDGIQAWGITGTAKPATTSDAPSNLPVGKDDADTAYKTQSGAAPTETDYFVCVDNDGNITYWYLSDDFTITSYDPITTEFKAMGAIRMAYHTTGDSAGTWTLDDFTSAESGGWNYLKNIRSCTREKLYYKGVEVWPNSPTMWSYNGTVLPALPDWDRETYPYAIIEYADVSAVVANGRLARLLCASEPIQYVASRFDLNYYGMLGDVQYFGFANNDGVWEWSFGMNEPYPPLNEWVKIGEEHFDERTNINQQVVAANLIWSNHKVVYSDDTTLWKPGTTKLEASDPIPVYE